MSGTKSSPVPMQATEDELRAVSLELMGGALEEIMTIDELMMAMEELELGISDEDKVRLDTFKLEDNGILTELEIGISEDVFMKLEDEVGTSSEMATELELNVIEEKIAVPDDDNSEDETVLEK